MALLKRYRFVLWGVVFLVVILFGRGAQLHSLPHAFVGGMWLLVGAVWLWTLRRYGWEGQHTPLNWGLVAVVFSLCVSSWLSVDPSRSWRMSLIWSALILVFGMAVLFLRTIQQKYEPVVVLYIYLVGLMGLWEYYETVVWLGDWYELFGWSLGVPRPPRIGVMFSPNILAVCFNFALFLGWGMWQKAGRGWWGWLLFLFFTPLLVLTGSRSGWVGFLAGCLLVVVVRWWHEHEGQVTWRLAVRLLALVGGAGGVLLLLIALLRPDTLQMSSRSAILYRVEFWSVAVEMWEQRPWVGQGVDTFGSFFMLAHESAPPAVPFRAAHSWWMSFLSETGLLGITAVLLCWFLIGRWLWAHRQARFWNPMSVGLLGGLGAFAVHATFDTPEPMVIFFAAVWLAMLLVVVEPEVTGGRKRITAVWMMPL